MNCKNCNYELDENSKFCPKCGTPVEAAVEQPAADVAFDNAPQPAEQAEAPAFEQPVNEAVEAPAVQNEQPAPAAAPENAGVYTPPAAAPENAGVYTPPVAATTAADTHEEMVKTKAEGKKNKIIGIIAFALIVLVAIAGVIFFVHGHSSKKASAPFVYFTDDSLYAMKSINEKEEPFLISKDYDSDGFMFSEDYKYIVYVEYKDEDFNLYARELFNEKAEAILLAKDIDDLVKVTGSIDAVYYEKNGDVYCTNLKDENNKLLSDASVSAINEDNTLMLCSSSEENEDYDYYDDYSSSYYYTLTLIDLKKNTAEKLTSAATDYEATADLSQVYFTEEGKLYVAGLGKEKSKIADADTVSDMYLVGNDLYYTVADEGQTFTYYDFVDDPYAESDASVVEPNWEDYAPSYDDYQVETTDDWGYTYTTTDWDAYYAARDAADAEYDAALEEYYAAYDREDLRIDLDEEASFRSLTLYRYSGSKSEQVAENVQRLRGIYSFGSNEDLDINAATARSTAGSNGYTGVLAYCYPSSLADIEKISIDDISSAYDVTEYVEENAPTVANIVSGAKLTKLDLGNEDLTLSSIYYNADSNEYLLGIDNAAYDDDDFYSEDLYSLKEGNDFSKAEKIAEKCRSFFYINGKIAYTDSYNEKSGSVTLHYDGNEIIDSTGSVLTEIGNTSDFYYATDYSSKTGESTVYKYSKGKSEKIGDDIYFSPISFGSFDGRYVYITEYDDDDYSGDLVARKGDKTFTIAKDVEGFLCPGTNYASFINSFYDYDY